MADSLQAPEFKPTLEETERDETFVKCRYWDGRVAGTFYFSSAPDGGSALGIAEFGSYWRGAGCAREALRWLRSQFAQVSVVSAGYINWDVFGDPDYPAEDCADPEMFFWERMRDEGLVDTIIDCEGSVVPPSWRDGIQDPESGARPKA